MSVPSTGNSSAVEGRFGSLRNAALTINPQSRTTTPRLEPQQTGRPTIRGKFFFAGDQKLWVRGVTYGAFRADENGREYQDTAQIESDFAQMAASGLNSVRIPHTTPPRALLDIAQRHGLRVMVGLSAEQYAGFLIDGKAPDIEAIVRKKVRSIAGHPALLCYGLGNEIQAPVARWIGSRPLERYLEKLYNVVKSEDPGGLVTYVNYPSTEYLSLPFLDFLCFNVYLESRERLSSYLPRLQNLAGDRPLIMGELGLDSMRNGEDAQADTVAWQIRTSFGEGCAGTYVFSWTDEWYRGNDRVDDWAFGLTRYDGAPKPSLAAASSAFSEVPFPPDRTWPRMSVVVCTHNGATTLRSCLEGVAAIDYPDYEIIVVNDGSLDASVAIASDFPVRLISTERVGLSSARNSGLHAATGEIVAYIDDDAIPDPDWLKYLADTFVSTEASAVGGPNVAPGGGGAVADSVESAPGGPTHVLLSDRLAEHIPGCNMAFRREALLAIGGFDAQFRTAGDDVDVCWRLLERGWTIGFNAGAVVMHHRRKSISAYWRQQWGYGRAEAQLERKWPEKYNSAGTVTWGGRLYGNGLARISGFAGRIYHGVWGGAPFQLLYQESARGLASLPLLPEWNLLVITLAVASFLGIFWRPLLVALPLLVLAIAAWLVGAAVSASAASYPRRTQRLAGRLARGVVTWFLFLIQPPARLFGRLRDGLTPWRARAMAGLASPWPRVIALWTDNGNPQEERLAAIEAAIRHTRGRVMRGGVFDRWDLEMPGGVFGSARLRMAVEEHGGGHQFVRVRIWPRWRRLPLFGVLTVTLVILAAWARVDSAEPVAIILCTAGILLSLRAIYDFAGAMGSLRQAAAPQMEQTHQSALMGETQPVA